MSLIQVLTGLALTAVVALLIGKGLGNSLKGLNATAVRQEIVVESQQVAMQLQRDFLRRQPANVKLDGPPVFKGDSGCKNLQIGQTLLQVGTRKIEYRTECTGPAFTDADARTALSPLLSDQCAGIPRVRVVTTQPDGKVTERVFPTRAQDEAAFLCVHLNEGFSTALAAELTMARQQGSRWRTTVKTIQLGLESGGEGIEIIPPQ